MVTLQKMTKHAAKKLSAEAVTVDEKKLAASAMAKVTKKGTTFVQEELDAAEDALDEIREEWPEFGVVTHAAGKQWPETEPPMDDIVLGFLKWRNTLKMPEVRQRIEHGLLQQNAARRQLVRDFSNAMKTYGSAIFAHDKEVRAANAAKLAEEQHEESDDLSRTSPQRDECELACEVCERARMSDEDKILYVTFVLMDDKQQLL